jgi:hypothetical protein
LHLLADRRSAYQTTFRAVNVAGGDDSLTDQGAANDSGVLPKMLTETALREQFAELRRALVAGVDTQTERITAEVRALLLEALPSSTVEQPSSTVTIRPLLQWGWIVASVALAIALATTALWWQQVNQLRTLTGEVAQLRHDLSARAGASSDNASSTAVADAAANQDSVAEPGGAASADAQKSADWDPNSAALPTDAKPLIVAVPYGSDALGGARLEVIRPLLDRLVKEKHSGTVDIKAFAGRFCLMGNATDGYSLAPDETLYAKCDVVGNPQDDALSAAQRTPLPFANLVGAVHNSSHGTLDVQTSTGDVTATVAPYPQISPDLTAGEWNRAGSVNNRIEIRVH